MIPFSSFPPFYRTLPPFVPSHPFLDLVCLSFNVHICYPASLHSVFRVLFHWLLSGVPHAQEEAMMYIFEAEMALE